MKTFKQSGEVLPVIAPYDVQRGSGVLIGQLFGLACATVNAGTSVDIMCKGEFVVDKVTTEAWAVGDKIYWNSSSKKFSNVGGGGLLVGLASESAVNPSLLGSLLLTQQPGLVDPVFNAVTGVVEFSAGSTKFAIDGNPVPLSLRNGAAGKSWLWKNPSTTQVYANSWWVYVPLKNSGYYSIFAFGNWSAAGTYVTHLARMSLGCAGQYVKHDAGAGVVKTGAWTTSALDYAPAGTTCYSVTAGDKITFTTRGHTLVARSLQTTNGGFMVVAVDGDYTAATRLPKFTSTDFSNSLCRESDIGKSYIDTGSTAPLPDVHTVISEGLIDAVHTVTFEATGTKGTYSSAVRSYIGGVVGCSSSDIGVNLSTNVQVIATIESTQEIAGASAMVFTPEVERVATGVFDFLGEVHVGETLEFLEFSVDGNNQTGLASGAYASGDVIQVRRVTTLAVVDNAAVPVIRKSFKFSMSGTQDIPCIVSWKATFLADKRVKSAYPLMLPIANEANRAGNFKNTRWNALTFGSYSATPADFVGNNNTQRGNVPALIALASSDLHDVVAYAAMLDGGASVDHFALASPSFVFMHDRSDGFDKTYFCRSTGSNLERFFTGDVIGGTVGFGIIKP